MHIQIGLQKNYLLSTLSWHAAVGHCMHDKLSSFSQKLLFTYNVIIVDDRRMACNLKHYITNCLSLILLLDLEVVHANSTHFDEHRFKLFMQKNVRWRNHEVLKLLMSAIIKWEGGQNIISANLKINFYCLVPLIAVKH